MNAIEIGAVRSKSYNSSCSIYVCNTYFIEQLILGSRIHCFLVVACVSETKATQKDMNSAYQACPELKENSNWGKGMPTKHLQMLVTECVKPRKK